MIERYSRDEIARIWELENKFRIWLDIEIAVCEIYAERGIIPKEDFTVTLNWRYSPSHLWNDLHH